MEANDFDALPYEQKLEMIKPGTIWTHRETGQEALVVGFDGEHVRFIENPTPEQKLLVGIRTLVESLCPDAASK